MTDAISRLQDFDFPEMLDRIALAVAVEDRMPPEIRREYRECQDESRVKEIFLEYAADVSPATRDAYIRAKDPRVCQWVDCWLDSLSQPSEPERIVSVHLRGRHKPLPRSRLNLVIR